MPARAAKAAVERSSSLWGISRCWRGVVQQQVELGQPVVRPERARGTVCRAGVVESGEWGLVVPWDSGGGAGLYLASAGPGGTWGQPCCTCHPGRAQPSAWPLCPGWEMGPALGDLFLLGGCCTSVLLPQPLLSPRALLPPHPKCSAAPDSTRASSWPLAGTQAAGVSRARLGLWRFPQGTGASHCGAHPCRAASPQVQGFLEVAGQAPDLVERYCGLYQRLRGATEELFGQQAAFMLALGQGFAGALLQLSFLATLHVSQGSVAPVPGPGVTSPWRCLGGCPGPQPWVSSGWGVS